MGEYTTDNEIRFCWNFDRLVSIYNNRAVRTHIHVVFSTEELKKICSAYGYRLPEVRLFYDGEEYKAFIDNRTSIITLVGTIQDRRRKGYRSPISFSYDDLNHVISCANNQAEQINSNAPE